MTLVLARSVWTAEVGCVGARLLVCSAVVMWPGTAAAQTYVRSSVSWRGRLFAKCHGSRGNRSWVSITFRTTQNLKISIKENCYENISAWEKKVLELLFFLSFFTDIQVKVYSRNVMKTPFTCQWTWLLGSPDPLTGVFFPEQTTQKVFFYK